MCGRRGSGSREGGEEGWSEGEAKVKAQGEKLVRGF